MDVKLFRTLLNASGMSQAELARATGLHRSMITLILYAKKPITRATRELIEIAFGLPIGSTEDLTVLDLGREAIDKGTTVHDQNTRPAVFNRIIMAHRAAALGLPWRSMDAETWSKLGIELEKIRVFVMRKQMKWVEILNSD